MAYYGGLESGITTAGKALSQMILGRADEERKREELELRKAEHDRRMREFDLREQEIRQRMAETQRGIGLRAALPEHLATLGRIQSFGTTEEDTTPGSYDVNFVDWKDTDQMLRESPAAMRAFTGASEALGKSPYSAGLLTPMEEARKLQREKELISLGQSAIQASRHAETPDEVEAANTLLLQVLFAQGKLSSGDATKIGETATDRAYDSAFLQASGVGPILEALSLDQALTPEQEIQAVQLFSNHPYSPRARAALKDFRQKVVADSPVAFLLAYSDALVQHKGDKKAAQDEVLHGAGRNPVAMRRLLALVEEKPSRLSLMPQWFKEFYQLKEENAGRGRTPQEDAERAGLIEAARLRARNTPARRLELYEDRELKLMTALSNFPDPEVEAVLKFRLQEVRGQIAALRRQLAGTDPGAPAGPAPPAPEDDLEAENDLGAEDDVQARMAELMARLFPGKSWDEMTDEDKQVLYDAMNPAAR